MIYSRYAGPLDDWIVQSATLSWSSGSVDSNYPAANAKDGDPGTVTKVTGTSGTLRASLGSQTAVGAAIFNTNATSISLQNGAGLNVSMTPMARDDDGYINAPWVDLTGMANITSGTWDFVLSKTGSAPLEVGEVRLIRTWRDLPILYGIKTTRVRAKEVLRTRLGYKLKWPSNVRADAWEGDFNRHDYLAALLALEAQSSGPMVPFTFIPLTTVNRAVLVEFAEDISYERVEEPISKVRIRLEELVAGTPPSAA